MVVEVVGEPDERGMVIDFQEIKKVLNPLVEAWDHAVLVADQDTELRQAIELLGTNARRCPLK